ncbi:MAG: hypothetical protein LBJ90_02610 [Treponema sp.]|nr:hypothetical protein [Treponema sp.]
MKKAVKIAIISAAAVAVAAGVLFVAIPLATSKQAEARLGEALAEAGIPEDMWSVGRTYYVPLLGHLVIEKLDLGGMLKAKKITLALNTGREDLFAGSVDVREASFSFPGYAADIAVKSLSVDDFSVDKAMFGYSPVEAVKKVGNIRLSNAVIGQRGRTYYSLGKFHVNAGYAEGKPPLPSSVSLKDLTMDVRQFVPLPVSRPEYRFSNIEFKNSLSDGVYTVDLAIDGDKLFAIKARLGVSLPHSLFASGEITALSRIDYGEDVKLNSLTLTYTDKSFLDHVFELAGMSGGRAVAAEQLNETLMMFAGMSGTDTERFAGEAAKFIAKPGKFELKTNIYSPVSFEEIVRNPFAVNLSLSINGGKPFTTR